MPTTRKAAAPMPTAILWATGSFGCCRHVLPSATSRPGNYASAFSAALLNRNDWKADTKIEYHLDHVHQNDIDRQEPRYTLAYDIPRQRPTCSWRVSARMEFERHESRQDGCNARILRKPHLVLHQPRHVRTPGAYHGQTQQHEGRSYKRESERDQRPAEVHYPCGRRGGPGRRVDGGTGAGGR